MPATDIRLVIFDWAGTTVDFGCLAPAGAFAAVFAARGVAVTPAEVRGPMGVHKKQHLREMFGVPAVAEKWRAAVGRDWAEADVDSLYAAATPLQVAAAKAHAALCPGVVEAVAELRRRGLKIGSTTGYFREAAEACYTAAAALGYTPDFNACADDVPAGRPAPWMVYRVMEALDVFPPTAVLKVGDTRADIEEAVNAGAWAVGVVDGSNEIGLSLEEFSALPDDEKDRRREAVREIFFAAGADGVIDSVAEVPAIVDELNKLLGEPD